MFVSSFFQRTVARAFSHQRVFLAAFVVVALGVAHPVSAQCIISDDSCESYTDDCPANQICVPDAGGNACLAIPDPAGCNVGVGFVCDPDVLNPVVPGQVIPFFTGVAPAGGTPCSFFGGQLRVTLPNGNVVDVAGYPATPVVPFVDGTIPAGVSFGPFNYTVDPADADPPNTVGGDLDFLVDYGETANFPAQTPGVVLEITAECGNASGTCDRRLGLCEVELDKQISCDGGATFVDVTGADDNDPDNPANAFGCNGWNAFNNNPPENIIVRYVIQNNSSAGTVLMGCVLTDSNSGILGGAGLPIADLPIGASDTIDINVPCSDALDAMEPDTATVVCECHGASGQGDDVMDSDTADFECLTPGLEIAKVCEDEAPLDGDNVITVLVTNTGDAPLINCTVTDEIFLADDTCPAGPAGGTPIALAPAGAFNLAGGASMQFTGTTGPLTADACNNVSVTCTIDETDKQISADDDDLCDGIDCGDGIINQAFETCDPPDFAPGVDCVQQCRAPNTTDECTCCGDNIIQGTSNETCDPPGSAAGNPGELCRDDCTVCGDNNIDAGEFCDGAAEAGGVDCTQSCRDDCTCCGDGVINGPPGEEECEPPGVGNCDANCKDIPQGGEGCTPGYWKLIERDRGNAHHECNWTDPYDPDDSFCGVFNCVNTCTQFGGYSLIEVLDQPKSIKPPQWRNLGFHTVAALLNAASPDVNFGLSVDDVINGFNLACTNDDLADAPKFSDFNECGAEDCDPDEDPHCCPLGNCTCSEGGEVCCPGCAGVDDDEEDCPAGETCGGRNQGDSDCCEAHDGSGCDDNQCTDQVCAELESCCDHVDAAGDFVAGVWDAACAAKALEICCAFLCEDAPPAPCVPTGGDNDDCANSQTICDGCTDFDTTAATTDGPDLFPFCDPGVFGDDIIHNDIWYDYEATCTGTLLVTTCEQLGGSADYDTRLAVYDGCGCPANPASAIGCNDDDPINLCGTGAGGFHSTVEVPVTAGNCYKIEVGAFSDFDVGTGSLCIACASPGASSRTSNPGTAGSEQTIATGESKGPESGATNTSGSATCGMLGFAMLAFLFVSIFGLRLNRSRLSGVRKR